MTQIEPTKSQKDRARYRMARIAAFGKDAKGEFPWRTFRQIAGMEGILQRAINDCTDGATVTVGTKFLNFFFRGIGNKFLHLLKALFKICS